MAAANSNHGSASNADPTADRLVQSAESLFAEKGYDGASVREITRAADCNIASVNYYFGDKLSLYHAVFQRRFTELRDQRVSSIRQVMNRPAPPPNLRDLIGGFAAAFVRPIETEGPNGNLLRLFAWEMISPRLSRETFTREMIDPVTKHLIPALRQLRPTLSEQAAMRCVNSLVGQLLHLIQMHRLFAAADDSQWEVFALPPMLAHVVEFTLAGIDRIAEGATDE